MEQVLMSKKEIQKISIEFRKIASRLLTTTFADGMGNLKRFLYYVNNTPLIKFFIQENNIKKFDIVNEIQNRELFNGYVLPFDKSEEISYIYQLLMYTTENYIDLYSLCGHYTSSNSYQDDLDSFNQRVTNPLVSHIEGYLKERLIDLEDNEQFKIIVNGGQVAIAKDNSTINAAQTNNLGNTQDLTNLIAEFKTLLITLKIDDEIKEDTIDLINVAVEETQSEKPKRGIIKTAIQKVEEISKLGTGVIALTSVGEKLVASLKTFI
ncbi:hypothetical protein [Bacillus cereus]